MIRGQCIVLTEIDPANAEVMRGWLTDPAVNEWLPAGHVPITSAAEREWYERAERESSAGTAYNFEIRTADDLRLLGICGLIDVDNIDRCAEVGIFIGETAEQNKGFGRDAIVTTLRFGFETLGLHTAQIRVIAGNDRALGLYESVGFSAIGTIREGRYVRGEFHDVMLLDMTRAEFDARYAS